VLPSSDSSRVALDDGSEFTLCQTGTLPEIGNQSAVSFDLGERDIAQESDDLRELLYTRFAHASLPELKRIEVDAEPVGDLLLLQAKLNSAPLHMLSYCIRFWGIPLHGLGMRSQGATHAP